MAGSTTERRRDRRLELTLPLEYALSPSSAAPSRGGQTRNVSSGGVYFETDADPLLEKDAVLTLRIAVPQRQDTGGPPLTLYGEGRVLRLGQLSPRDGTTAASPPRWGVAVAFSAKPTVRMSSLIEYLMGEIDPAKPVASPLGPMPPQRRPSDRPPLPAP